MSDLQLFEGSRSINLYRRIIEVEIPTHTEETTSSSSVLKRTHVRTYVYMCKERCDNNDYVFYGMEVHSPFMSHTTVSSVSLSDKTTLDSPVGIDNDLPFHKYSPVALNRPCHTYLTTPTHLNPSPPPFTSVTKVPLKLSFLSTKTQTKLNSRVITSSLTHCNPLSHLLSIPVEWYLYSPLPGPSIQPVPLP